MPLSDIKWNPLQAPNMSTSGMMMDQASRNLSSGMKGLQDLSENYRRMEIAQNQAQSDDARSTALNALMKLDSADKVGHAISTGAFDPLVARMTPADRLKFDADIGSRQKDLVSNYQGMATGNLTNAQANEINKKQIDSNQAMQSFNNVTLRRIKSLMGSGDLNLNNKAFMTQQLLNERDGHGNFLYANQEQRQIAQSLIESMYSSKFDVTPDEQRIIDQDKQSILDNFNLASQQYLGDENTRELEKINKFGLTADKYTSFDPETEAANKKLFHEGMAEMARESPNKATLYQRFFNQDNMKAITDGLQVDINKAGFDEADKKWLNKQVKPGEVPTGLLVAALNMTGGESLGFDPLHGFNVTMDNKQFIAQARHTYLQLLLKKRDREKHLEDYTIANQRKQLIENRLPGLVGDLIYKQRKGIKFTPAETNLWQLVTTNNPELLKDPKALGTVVSGISAETLQHAKVEPGSYGDKIITEDHELDEKKSHYDKVNAENQTNFQVFSKSQIENELNKNTQERIDAAHRLMYGKTDGSSTEHPLPNTATTEPIKSDPLIEANGSINVATNSATHEHINNIVSPTKTPEQVAKKDRVDLINKRLKDVDIRNAQDRLMKQSNVDGITGQSVGGFIPLQSRPQKQVTPVNDFNRFTSNNIESKGLKESLEQLRTVSRSKTRKKTEPKKKTA